MPLDSPEILLSEEDQALYLLAWQLIGAGYPSATIQGKTVYLHRVVLERKLGRELVEGEEVDHINNIPTDNRRSNLRVATRSQNLANRRKQANNTSGFKGVDYRKDRKKWRATISIKGVVESLGHYDTPEEAHEAYKIAALKEFGEFARFE